MTGTPAVLSPFLSSTEDKGAAGADVYKKQHNSQQNKQTDDGGQMAEDRRVTLDA